MLVLSGLIFSVKIIVDFQFLLFSVHVITNMSITVIYTQCLVIIFNNVALCKKAFLKKISFKVLIEAYSPSLCTKRLT